MRRASPGHVVSLLYGENRKVNALQCVPTWVNIGERVFICQLFIAGI